MSCLCQSVPQMLAVLNLPTLGVPAVPLTINATAQAVLAANARLALGLPGLPPLPTLSLTLPRLMMSTSLSASASAVANLSMFLQLPVLLARLNINLAEPIGVTAIARLTATLNARLGAILALRINFGPWLQLAGLNLAVANLTAAVNAGLALNVQVVTPAAWQPFALNIQGLSMLLSLCARLNVSLTSPQFAAQLSALLSLSASLRLPAINLQAVAQLSAGLSAIAQLSASLGVNPLTVGFPQIQALVVARFQALLQLLASLNINLQLPVVQLPGLPALPMMSLNATVQAALALNVPQIVLPSLPMPPALVAAMTVASCAVNLSAVAVAPALSPCSICDASAIMASASLSV